MIDFEFQRTRKYQSQPVSGTVDCPLDLRIPCYEPIHRIRSDLHLQIILFSKELQLSFQRKKDSGGWVGARDHVLVVGKAVPL